MTTSRHSLGKPPLSILVLVLLALHALGAFTIGIVGIVQSTGSDGFGDLALVVSILLAALWLAGTVLSWAIARYLLTKQWVRVVFVIIGPLLGMVVLVLVARG